MVFDERSLRTRQRPVRSGALRGAKSENSTPAAFSVRPHQVALEWQPSAYHRLLPVKDQINPKSLPACLSQTRPDAPSTNTIVQCSRRPAIHVARSLVLARNRR